LDTLAPITPGQPFDILLRLTIAPGYHIQAAHTAQPDAIATVARLRATDETVELSQEWHYPPTTTFASVEGGTGYWGTIIIRARCTLPPHARPRTLRATVIAQPCTHLSCLPPEQVTIEFPLEFTPDSI